MENINNSIKQNITQVFLIVFSVVLGLYLSERIEERKRQQESESMFAIIKSEAKENIRLLNKWVPYHREIYKNLDSLVKDELFIKAFINDRSIFTKTLFTEGTFMGRFPSSDAWEIAKSHPLIVNIDYDKLLILSKIHKQQELTFEPGLQMFELLNVPDLSIERKAESNLGLLKGHMFELVARENQLMAYYREAVEILDL